MITEEYRALNKRLHASNPNFGVSGSKWAVPIRELCDTLESYDVLDYGCGKSTLAKALVFQIAEYDPAIDGKDSPPEPHDVVSCTDVLEHIEPDQLDAVLDDLRRVTKRAGFFVIATRPAKKILDDGRNAHLIQQPITWWLPKIWERFQILQFNDLGGEFVVIVK